MFEIKRAKRLSQAWVHFVTALASLLTDHRMSGLPIRARYKHFKTWLCPEATNKRVDTNVFVVHVHVHVWLRILEQLMSLCATAEWSPKIHHRLTKVQGVFGLYWSCWCNAVPNSITSSRCWAYRDHVACKISIWSVRTATSVDFALEISTPPLELSSSALPISEVHPCRTRSDLPCRDTKNVHRCRSYVQLLYDKC